MRTYVMQSADNSIVDLLSIDTDTRRVYLRTYTLYNNNSNASDLAETSISRRAAALLILHARHTGTVSRRSDINAIHKLAKGRLQRKFVKKLIYLHFAPRYDRGLRGRAASYGAHYQRHQDALLKRIRRAGWPLIAILGPRGGVTGWKLVS